MEERIYEYLIKNCRGFENRIKGYELMKIFRINDHKTLRSYIEAIRQNEDCLELIGSRAGKDGGYYVITSKTEFEDTVNHMYLRAMEMLHTQALMKKKASKNQLKLEF